VINLDSLDLVDDVRSFLLREEGCFVGEVDWGREHMNELQLGQREPRRRNAPRVKKAMIPRPIVAAPNTMNTHLHEAMPYEPPSFVIPSEISAHE
jgi:hypothetical protein